MRSNAGSPFIEGDRARPDPPTPPPSNPHQTQEEADSHRSGTSVRNAKISNVAYHNFTAMVGAGVLALPAVMAGLGWGFGTVALFLSWFISWITFVFLVQVRERKMGVRVSQGDGACSVFDQS